MNPFTPISQFVKIGTDTWPSIIQHVEYIRKLKIALIPYIPDIYQNHVTLANIRGNVLVLYANSSVWSTRLRYQIPELLETLSHDKNFDHINRIELKIRPVSSEMEFINKNQSVGISAQSRGRLLEAANTPSEALNASLKRLAKTVSKT